MNLFDLFPFAAVVVAVVVAAVVGQSMFATALPELAVVDFFELA